MQRAAAVAAARCRRHRERSRSGRRGHTRGASLTINPVLHISVIEATVATAANGRQGALACRPVDPGLRNPQPVRDFIGCAQ